MRTALLTIAALLVVISSCKKDEPATDDSPKAEAQEKTPGSSAPEPGPPDPPPPEESAGGESDAAAPESEPSSPEEVTQALKTAMVEGNDEEVIKYCEKLGVGAGKGDPQTALGCTLSACRTKQQDKARAWSKGLPKELKKQANEICMANKVIL